MRTIPRERPGVEVPTASTTGPPIAQGRATLRSVRRLAPVGLAIVVLSAGQSGSLAATQVHDVSITAEYRFDPFTTDARIGQKVRWTDLSGLAHTTTSDGFDREGTGVGLWKQPLERNESWTFRFVAGGIFWYHCSLHPTMRGSIAVAPKARPTIGAVGDPFKIVWATADPGPDLVFNILVKAPGSKYRHRMMGVPHDQLSAVFVPTEPGIYLFSTQLKRVSTGGASGYSPDVTITVGT